MVTCAPWGSARQTMVPASIVQVTAVTLPEALKRQVEQAMHGGTELFRRQQDVDECMLALMQFYGEDAQVYGEVGLDVAKTKKCLYAGCAEGVQPMIRESLAILPLDPPVGQTRQGATLVHLAQEQWQHRPDVNGLECNRCGVIKQHVVRTDDAILRWPVAYEGGERAM